MSPRRVLVRLVAGGALLVWSHAAAQCPAGVEVVDPFLRLRKVSPPGVRTGAATRIKFVGRLAVPSSPPIDPGTRGIRLVIQDGDVVTIDATLPGGAYDASTERGWITAGSDAHTYRDARGTVAGILRAVVRTVAGDGGLATVKVVVFGQDGVYPVPPDVADATVVLDPPSSVGQCGAAALPDCRFRNQGDKLLCRGLRPAS
jgi:hypothetical protein